MIVTMTTKITYTPKARATDNQDGLPSIILY